MQKNEGIQIHKNSEIWDYEGKVEFTQELVDFFEEERKLSEHQRKSDKRHIAFEKLDNYITYKSIAGKRPTIDEQVEVNIMLENVNEALGKKRRSSIMKA